MSITFFKNLITFFCMFSQSQEFLLVIDLFFLFGYIGVVECIVAEYDEALVPYYYYLLLLYIILHVMVTTLVVLYCDSFWFVNWFIFIHINYTVIFIVFMYSYDYRDDMSKKGFSTQKYLFAFVEYIIFLILCHSILLFKFYIGLT